MLIGIEGNSFSGKSYLCEKMQSRIDVVAVSEYRHYVSNFPNFPPKKIEDALAEVEFFLNIEQQRSERAKSFLELGKKVVMDRTIWSILSFRYVLYRTDRSIPNGFSYAIKKIEELAENGKILLPPQVVVLSPDKELFLKNVEDRGRLDIDFLNDPKTVGFMNEFFDVLREEVYDSGKVHLLPLTKENRDKSIEKIVNMLDAKESGQIDISKVKNLLCLI